MARKWSTRPPQPARAPGTGPWTWLAVVAGLAVGAGGLVALVFVLKPESDAPFRPYVAGYLALANSPGTALPPGPLNGRMLVLDAEKQKVDKLHFLLPHTQRARKPEEVVYVVTVRYRRESAGVYRKYVQGTPSGPEIPAYRWDCDVVIVEAATRRRTATTIRGPDPPDAIRERAVDAAVAPIPTLLVREHLMGLAGGSR